MIMKFEYTSKHTQKYTMNLYDFIQVSVNGGIMHYESRTTLPMDTYQSYENMFTYINAYTTPNNIF